MKTIKSLFKDFPFLFISVFAGITFVFFFYGCESRIASINEPNKMVNFYQLNAEVDAFLDVAAARYEELENKEILRQKVISSGVALAQSSGFDYLGILSTFGNILLGGVAIDNIRLRREKLKKK